MSSTKNLHTFYIFQINTTKGDQLDQTKVFEPCTAKIGSSGRIVEFLVNRGYNNWIVQSIPIGFLLPILSSLYECRLSPPLVSWSPEAYALIGRPELANCTASNFEV
jgi:hypothetical protein